ncbi:GlxA family transcriptional regulator [Thalassolituus sp. UBA1505]|nr:MULTISPECIES: helix-turn-helix domain-containing protein [unclassified Thalassolituus]
MSFVQIKVTSVQVSILVSPLCSAASVTLAQEILYAANLFSESDQAAEPLFAIQLVSLDGQPVKTSAGLMLAVDKSIQDVADTDLILIPGFLFSLRDVMPELVAYAGFLQQQHGQGSVIASMCNGSFLLAESGLLNGVEATTHWAFADLFRKRYPGVNLDESQILCDTGQLVSGGGATAALDLLLHLVRRFGSAELAHTCSRYLLIDHVRPKQSPYVMWTMPKNHGDEQIRRVQQWLEQNFSGPVTIDDVAAKFGFGVRNFKRRFKEATDQTPISYLQNIRLERAKYLLESTRRPISSITFDVGYEDVNSFRRLFRKRVGVSPMEYRERFCD